MEKKRIKEGGCLALGDIFRRIYGRRVLCFRFFEVKMVVVRISLGIRFVN